MTNAASPTQQSFFVGSKAKDIFLIFFIIAVVLCIGISAQSGFEYSADDAKWFLIMLIIFFAFGILAVFLTLSSQTGDIVFDGTRVITKPYCFLGFKSKLPVLNTDVSEFAGLELATIVSDGYHHEIWLIHKNKPNWNTCVFRSGNTSKTHAALEKFEQLTKLKKLNDRVYEATLFGRRAA